jgi:hypothetical protein
MSNERDVLGHIYDYSLYQFSVLNFSVAYDGVR